MNCRVHNVFALTRDIQERASQCQTCMKKALCPVHELVSPQAHGTPVLVQQTIQPDQTVFNAGERFDGLYMVRSGFFKSCFIDADGVMQVTGFHFPGEIFGMDGMETGFHDDTVQALDTGSICKIPLPHVSGLVARTNPGRAENVIHLNERGPQGDSRLLPLLKIMGRTMARDRRMIFALGKMCARQRFASFLLDLSARMAQSGYDSSKLRLCMSRTDIANHLCLALETVSRLFTQLQAMGVIEVERRNLKILDMQALEALVHIEAGAVARSTG